MLDWGDDVRPGEWSVAVRNQVKWNRVGNRWVEHCFCVFIFCLSLFFFLNSEILYNGP